MDVRDSGFPDPAPPVFVAQGMQQASDEVKIDQSLAETLNRLRVRRRPPRKVLLQLQLADALLERSGRETPQRTDEDVNQGRDMLFAATGVELDATDVPELARVVDDRADLVVPRGDRLTILQRTIAWLELAGARVQEAPLRPDAGRIVPAAFARELQDWLFRISLKRTITTGADVHLQHTVTLAQRMAQLPPPIPKRVGTSGSRSPCCCPGRRAPPRSPTWTPPSPCSDRCWQPPRPVRTTITPCSPSAWATR